MPINTDQSVHNLVVCANVFVRKDGKYLLIKRSPLKTHLPGLVHAIGGKVELNENPYLAAKREVLEEAGIEVDNLRLEAVVMELAPHPGSDINWLIFHFSGDYSSGEVIQTEEGELVYMTAEELKEQKLYSSLERIIDRLLNPDHGTVFATFTYDGKGNIIDSANHIDGCVI